MARILFAWELGGNLGHLSQLLPVADALNVRHQLVFTVQNAALLKKLRPGATVFQAPLTSVAQEPHPPNCYLHILSRYCFGRAKKLEAVIDAWQRHYANIRPDMVVCNAAPIAQLTAFQLGIKTVLIGDGFSQPPPGFPPFRTTLENSDRSNKNNKLLLEETNRALRANGLKVLHGLSSIAPSHHAFLTTYPELDHYGVRSTVRYYGPIYQTYPGNGVRWRRPGKAKVFAYVRAAHPLTYKILEACAHAECAISAYVPDAGEEIRSLAAGSNMVLSESLLDLNDAARNCDWAICHGGHSTVAQFLLAGKPLLILPGQLEQGLTGRNVARLKAGMSLTGAGNEEILDAAVRKMTSESDYSKWAKQYAAEKAGTGLRSRTETVATRLEELLG